MRVISQNGEVDLPYERIVVMQNFDSVIAVTDLQETQIVLGRYSSSERAEKAIKMLRDAYREYFATKIGTNGIGGTFAIMENTDLNNKIADIVYEKLKSSSCFQFPKDDEVEV